MDGKPAEIKLVGDCMVAVNLTKGVHNVRLMYHNAAFSLGWKISLACAAVSADWHGASTDPTRSTKNNKYAAISQSGMAA